MERTEKKIQSKQYKSDTSMMLKKKTFGVKQSDRYSILKQLKLLLSDELPKIVIRTDIESFYESIPQDDLKDIIENNTLLTYQSKQFISSILDKYELLKCNSITNQRVGIPRGIGISAYLAELYMRDIDQRIGTVRNVTYWTRYVGDSLVFKPKIVTPYWHMSGEPFGRLISKEGNEVTKEDVSGSIYSISNLQKQIAYAEIDMKLFELLQS